MSDVGEDSRPIVLWIHPGGLYPVTGGGAARTWALVDYLRDRGFRVDLLTGNQGEYNGALTDRVDRLWIQEEPAECLAGRGQRGLRPALKKLYRRFDPDLRRLYRLNVLAGGRVAPVETNAFARNRRTRLERYAGEVACRIRPAIAIASYVWLAPALDRMPPGTLRVIDTIDIQHARQAAARAAGGSLPHASCTREEEARELNRADVLLAIQAGEAGELRALCPARDVILAEHAHPVPEYVPSDPASREMLYVGNLYDPNVLGLRTILKDMWPVIRARCPEAKLTVCGRVCEAIRRPPAGVTLEGPVPDLTPYYAGAAVVLNPVPYGTGLKIKTVEGLAHGRCVVCSEAGAGGLGDTAKLPLIAADPKTGMADQIVSVLNDATLRHDYEKRAWDYAQAHFSSDAVYRELLVRLQCHIADDTYRGNGTSKHS